MFWAVLSVFAFIACAALINHFYNKNHTEQVATVTNDEHFVENKYSVSFEHLMPYEQKHLELIVNPVVVTITNAEKISNPHVAVCVAAQKAFESVSKLRNVYVDKLIELRNKVQRTPNILGRDSEVCRGIKAKMKYVYDDGTMSPEWDMLYKKDQVDFAHKDWYSV